MNEEKWSEISGSFHNRTFKTITLVTLFNFNLQFDIYPILIINIKNTL